MPKKNTGKNSRNSKSTRRRSGLKRIIELKAGDIAYFGETLGCMIVERPSMPGHYFRRAPYGHCESELCTHALQVINTNGKWITQKDGLLCKKASDPVRIVAIDFPMPNPEIMKQIKEQCERGKARLERAGRISPGLWSFTVRSGQAFRQGE